MNTYSVPPDVPDSDISNKEFIIKINKLIKQKDVLITSLKDTITNLSNIIITNGQNAVKMNEDISTNIDKAFLDKHMKKMEDYVKYIRELELENSSTKLKLEHYQSESNKAIFSYNVLNEIYIDLINDMDNDNTVYTKKITNLGNTIDGIKVLHDNQTKSIRSYYCKQLLNKSGIECQRCHKENVTKVFLPCKHMVVCTTCFNTKRDNDDVASMTCYKCYKVVESVIDVDLD
tara:strand:+ start:212 stop:907 length:696 start_codon:yes stop_codon:yes gene_type:complete